VGPGTVGLQINQMINFLNLARKKKYQMGANIILIQRCSPLCGSSHICPVLQQKEKQASRAASGHTLYKKL
jgi:hypothetical protein